MIVSDNRYGAEIITRKGKVYKFDDSHCLLSFIQSKAVEKKEMSTVYFTDFTGNHTLIKADDAFLFQSESFRGPMNGNIAAFSNEDSMKKIAQQQGIAYKKGDKDGLAGWFKVMGQVGLGLIIALTLIFNENVKAYREYTGDISALNQKDIKIVRPDSNSVRYFVKSDYPITTIPFVKSHEFNYSRLLPEVIGRTAKKDIPTNTLVRWGQLV